MTTIRRGLDLPILGEPQQVIQDGSVVSSVALIGFDYHGMKPTMAVKEGDRVKLGQLLFTDKKTEGVKYTSPGAGVVKAINRGDRRVFQSIVIELDGDEQETFTAVAADQLDSISKEDAVATLVDSGLWTALRTRPYSKVPAPATSPASIFVNAMDTNPLAANPEVVIGERSDDFVAGLKVLTKLTDGSVNLCAADGANVAGADVSGVQGHRFGGVHPAGLSGTHIHFIDPVNANKTVWTIGYQDVIAIGALFTTGKIDTARVVAIGGPEAKQPRLVRTRLGANLQELMQGEVNDGDVRVISGSVFNGRKSAGNFAFLGRYHQQVSVLKEGGERPFLHYFTLGANRHSVMPTYISSLGKKKLAMTTSTNGSERAMVPVGNYEKVMPLDILPTQLLRALIVGDTEMAQKLGCLELDEEDLALCTYVCVGKYEYGTILRDNLTRIEVEG